MMFRNLAGLLSLLLALPAFSAENVKAFGPVVKANLKAVGAVAEANIKAVGVVDNTAVSTLDPGLLWLKFSEGSGTLATNSAAAGLSNLVHNASWVTGKSGSGYALDFNGTSMVGTVSNVVFGTDVITLTAWAFLDATNQASNGLLFESTTNINFLARNFRAWFTTAGLLHVGIHGATDNDRFRVETATAPQTNAWVHIGIVLDNSSTAGDVKIYYDAVAQTTSIAVNNKNITGNFVSTNLFIGARSAMHATRSFLDGRLDDVRIYSGELTSGQLSTVMGDAQ